MATTNDRRALPTTRASALAATHDQDYEDREDREGGHYANVRHSGLRPPPPIDGIVGRCLGGKLIVGDRIGDGALGAVYRAKHVLLPQPVAVKVLHEHCQSNETSRARFLAEAQAASVLDHPSLVRVVDFGEERGGLMWLAMELLEGAPLDAHLRDASDGRLRVERAVEILLDVCAGLAHAHERGIIHGDVKPSNIVLVTRLDDDGDLEERAKLCDFGVARGGGREWQTPPRAQNQDARGRASRDHDDDEEVLESGSRPTLLASAYLSPEQRMGGEDLDARTDVYACGVLFYEMVMGDSGLNEDAASVQRKSLLMSHGLLTSRRGVIEARVDALVSKAIAKDRSDRFVSMREMRAALRELATDLGLRARRSNIAQVLEVVAQERSILPPPMSIPISPLASSSLPAPATDPAPPPSFEEQSTRATHEEITAVRANVVSKSDVRSLYESQQPERDERIRREVASDLADFLRARVELLDREKHALSELLQRGTVDAIAWRVAKLLARAESSRGRDTVAIETLRLLETPANLSVFAERLLAEDVLESPYLERILTTNGRAVAQALWSARISRSGSIKERRARFVSWMKVVGTPAREALRVSLVKLAPYAESMRHSEVIEDVLLALPSQCDDDDLLAVIVRFANSPSLRVRELALSSMARALD